MSNERLPVPGFMADYEDLVARYVPECPRVEPCELDRFFGHTSWHLTENYPTDNGRFGFDLPLALRFPQCRVMNRLMEELHRLFEEHQKEGRVTLLYETEIYFGTLQE